MENLENKAKVGGFKNWIKKHPKLVVAFVALNLGYAPFSVAWKVYAIKVAYDIFKPRNNVVNVQEIYSGKSNYEDWFVNCQKNRMDRVNGRIDY